MDLIHRDFLASMVHHYATSATVEPMPHALEVFATLRDGGIRVALDTGFSRPILNSILRRLGWDSPKILDATVASDEVARGRPAPTSCFTLYGARRSAVARPAVRAARLRRFHCLFGLTGSA